MQLVPVNHDPFSADPMAGHLNSLHTELAITANKLSELVAKIESIGAAARQLDAVLSVEVRRVAEAVDAGATHFDDKLTGIRADIAADGWTSSPANLTRAKDAAYGHARHLLVTLGPEDAAQTAEDEVVLTMPPRQTRLHESFSQRPSANSGRHRWLTPRREWLTSMHEELLPPERNVP
jgi:hypothetical protein